MTLKLAWLAAATAVNNWAWLCQNSHVLHKIKVNIKFNR